MNKFLFFILAVIFAINAQAQTTKTTPKKSSFAMPSRDYVMLQFGYDSWANVPDSIKIGGLGRAFNAYLCYEFPIQKSNFSFAAGAGIATSNIYLKNQQVILSDTLSYIQFVNEKVDYKKYKYSSVYVEAPFEFRYFQNKDNKNVGFKAAVGLKVGTVLAAHTKSKQTVSNKPLVEKVNTKRYLETWRYAATARIGWGNFSLYGQYAISNLFKVASGPENVRPFQVGISISGL